MKQTVLVALAGDKERADVVALIDNHQLERISAFKGRGLTKRVGQHLELVLSSHSTSF